MSETESEDFTFLSGSWRASTPESPRHVHCIRKSNIGQRIRHHIAAETRPTRDIDPSKAAQLIQVKANFRKRDILSPRHSLFLELIGLPNIDESGSLFLRLKLIAKLVHVDACTSRGILAHGADAVTPPAFCETSMEG